MEQPVTSSANTSEGVQRTYARADSFAWLLMVALTFAGFIGVQLALRDYRISLVFAAVCLIGMISRELYLVWTFKGKPPAPENHRSRSPWLGNVIHILFVMAVWLVIALSEGPLTLRSFIPALISGLALGAFLWWRQSRSSGRRRAPTHSS